MFFAAWFLVLSASILVGADAKRQTLPAPEWDAVFDLTDGWIGGDAIYSTPLPNGDILWLFADTFIGQVKDHRRQPGVRMVNNTLARHPSPSPDKPPEPKGIQFLWGKGAKENELAAWITPTDAQQSKEWFWVADALSLPAKDQPPRLVVFLWRIASSKASGSMGFQVVGTDLALIDNSVVDWTTWKPRQLRIQHPPPTSGESPEKSPKIIWGSEVVIDPETKGDPAVLIFGFGTGKTGGNTLHAAKAPVEQIETMADWQFRTTDGWTEKLEEAATLANGLTTEFSISSIGTPDLPLWVLIQSELLFGHNILARTATSPFGPWSKPAPIYTIPDINKEKKHFTYAAKAHPELSAPGELLISYVVNSFDFGEVATNANIYRPRFVRAPFSLLPTPP